MVVFIGGCMANKTVVFYVNYMGGGGPYFLVMNKLATQLWKWCLEKFLQNTYPGQITV